MLASIIIPTYNRAEKVVEAIRSVQRQTYPETQIIVVDDGSRDDTRERIAELPGVEYYYQDNSRQGAARNKGFEYARGHYIATLDSDDTWKENFLSESIDCLERHRLDFVFSNWMMYRDGKRLPSAWEKHGDWKKYIDKPSNDWFLLDPQRVRELFINTCPAPSSSLLIRRKSMSSGWNTSLRIADDWCLILDMVLAKPCRAAFTLRRLWNKQVHGQNIYEGRSRREIAAELEIHDTKLMKERFAPKLSLAEKAVLNRRIIKGNLILGAYFVKNTLGIKRSLKFW